MRAPDRSERTGVLMGLAAYVCWGVFPLYWPLLEPAGAVEILGQRIVWSAVVVTVVLLVRRMGRPRLTRRQGFLIAGASVVLSINWGLYIWGVNHGHVLETSLGYFINPLFTVLLGVFVLGERLRGLQRVAVVIATVAVIGLTIDYGRPPWIALVLAASFGSYGLLKKFAGVGAVDSLAVETWVLTPVALVFLLVTASTSTFASHGPDHVSLLIGTGVVTTVPLLFFGGAVTRVPLTTLGLLQYVAPTLQFACGVVIRHESLPATRLVGFALVWVALAVFSYDALRSNRRAALDPRPMAA